MQRREFLTSALVGGAALIAPGTRAADTPAPAGRRSRLRVAGLQMLVAEHDVAANEQAIHRAIDRAAAEGVEFLLTPESGLSGYHVEFDQQVVAGAVERLREHARASRVGLLLGTGYRESMKDAISGAPGNGEACYNQVRAYTPDGEYLGFHAKILLTSPIRQPGTGEMRSYLVGALRTFRWNGVCFGILICNDLWATPGATVTPNPYLAWRLKEQGAQVIFHAVNTAGTPLFFRSYHESNESLWAGALGVPVVSTNAANLDLAPTNCQSGVWGSDGQRRCVAPDTGEQFFSCEIELPT